MLAFNNKNIETVPAVHDVVLDVEGMLVAVHVTVHRHLHQEEANVRGDNLGQSRYHPRIQRNHLLVKQKNIPGHEKIIINTSLVLILENEEMILKYHSTQKSII